MSVTGLARSLASAGVNVTLASLNYQEHGGKVEAGDAKVVSVVPSQWGKRLRGWSPAFAAALEAVARNGLHVVHNHGLWMYPGVYARRLAQKHGIPLVIAPRGMLDDWSRDYNARRKALALAFYERANLDAAALFHATSELEAQAIRRAGWRQPIAVVPNALAVTTSGAGSIARDVLESRLPELKGRRWLLYMGRLHPKKGLSMLLHAWSKVAAGASDWHLVIAGPDLTGHGAELQSLTQAQPALGGSVTLAGMLEGQEKDCALHNADLFVLPTLSENFGMVVLEALAAGVPVVTTTAAPWHDLITYDCGWWVEPTQAALEQALMTACLAQAVDLKAMGLRGRRMATQKYSWDAAARSMADVYHWLDAGGPAPACVTTE